jgi:hypothetical protein
MAIQNPPLTDNPTLNFALLELIREVNNSEQRLLRLVDQIKTSTDFADLQAKVKER